MVPLAGSAVRARRLGGAARPLRALAQRCQRIHPLHHRSIGGPRVRQKP
ncbi:hypothetical protein [Actinopolymorpha alba]|nr:hypothetical protein [Actinopolymorpha alba]